jgi:Arc/MetJ family transcription regulator
MELSMRTTVTIDDELYAQALEVIDPQTDKSELFREALKVFIRVESAKRLAALGGKAPQMRSIPRRQAKTLQGS